MVLSVESDAAELLSIRFVLVVGNPSFNPLASVLAALLFVCEMYVLMGAMEGAAHTIEEVLQDLTHTVACGPVGAILGAVAHIVGAKEARDLLVLPLEALDLVIVASIWLRTGFVRRRHDEEDGTRFSCLDCVEQIFHSERRK